MTKPITFIVAGEAGEAVGVTRGAERAPAALFPEARVKHSIRPATQRAAGGRERATAVPGEDVVVLHIADGPVLVLHPENARELMKAQHDGTATSSSSAAAKDAADEVEVPGHLRWAGFDAAVSARGVGGWAGGVVLKAFEVLTGVGKGGAADRVASRVAKLVDSQVNPGVYKLSPSEALQLGTEQLVPRIPASASDKPLLVLVHGTFSSTERTFRKLWLEHPHLVRAVFQSFGDRVYALDHETLGRSPIANALRLAKALPDGARLNLLTHSRGGLVAEVLARLCNDPVLTEKDDRLFAGAGLQQQRDELHELADLVRSRRIRVDRIVRVACPARGTLLASKRLDAYVSVFKWTLDLAGLPVAPEIVDFLGEVARRRLDPMLLPGLAAQVPRSPLIEWLHAATQPLSGDLRVISGDIEGDSLTSWLKTLVADAFYWTDNDFVVQTRSMYGGSPRQGGATFLYDRGGKVSHFNYFSNKLTAEAITAALTSSNPSGFRLIGPLSWSGEDSSGVRGIAGAAVRADQPAVFMLPGILGSNLKVNGERVWLSWRVVNGLRRLTYDAGQQNVEADGPIEAIYDKLAAHFAATHEVIPFAFDWRRPIEEEARRLGAEVSRALDARVESRQPVRIVAHSMGGLVARVMQLESPEVWQRMMSIEGARVLMLGTPNGGSWAPMQVLSGDDTFGNMLVSVGSLFGDHAARQLMADMPGFIQLQAGLLNPDRPLDQASAWRQLADDDLAAVRQYNFWHGDPMQLIPYEWGVPPQAVLDQAVALRRRLDRQLDDTLPAYADKMALVVGKASFTPDGYDTGQEGLFYLDATDGGDGRVTLPSAFLPGVRTWQLDCTHGDLPSREQAFGAYTELLEKGSTDLLAPVQSPATRGGVLPQAVRVPSRPSRTRGDDTPPERPIELLRPRTSEPAASPRSKGPALQVTVVNGDLMFERLPLVLGHYTATRLTGTERVMNGLIGNTMRQALEMGQYPDGPRSNRVFLNAHADPDNPWKPPRPKAVVVVGLGPEGKLQATDLRATVASGVIAWAQRLIEARDGGPKVFEIAATLIGSGGIGVTVGESAQSIVRGVGDANRQLAELGWPIVGRLQLIDLYLDRASEAWRALQVASSADAELCRVSATIETRAGALERPLDSGYRGAEYDFISAVEDQDEGKQPAISYTLDTRRARSEVRAQTTQGALLRELLRAASTDANQDTQLGRTLFKLLIPLELRAFFSGTTDMQLELDQNTAAIPWELLDVDIEPGAGDRRPWSVRAKLLRKLRTQKFRERVVDASVEAGVLIIGEPACNPARYRRLPNARAEAEVVSKRFAEALASRSGDEHASSVYVKTLISSSPTQSGPDARTIMNALFERPWRIVHIAGHGEPPLDDNPRGVVLSNGTFLGANEIRNLEVVPELVFVNCCHLAAQDARQLFDPSAAERARFAAGVAEELIKIGVRCVIAAGWAISDSAADMFATEFYGALMKGHRFIDAVAHAREASLTLGGNTWAAYQCYGDPDWSFRKTETDAQRPTPLPEQFASVASASSLVLALRTLEIMSQFGSDAASLKQAQIRYLQDRFERVWGKLGTVAEAFGAAWDAAGDVSMAAEWYSRAVSAPDGTASLKAVEQLANLRIRNAAERASQAGHAADAATLRAARAEIFDHIDKIEKLIALQTSMERESLIGSAYKRLALLAGLEKNSSEEKKAIARMQTHYRKAAEIGREQGHRDMFYPLMNRVVGDLLAGAGAAPMPEVAKAARELMQMLESRSPEDSDFWSIVGMVDLHLFEAIANCNLASEQARIEEGYNDVHARVAAPRWWASVHDTAELVLRNYAARTNDAPESAAAHELAKCLKGFCA